MGKVYQEKMKRRIGSEIVEFNCYTDIWSICNPEKGTVYIDFNFQGKEYSAAIPSLFYWNDNTYFVRFCREVIENEVFREKWLRGNDVRVDVDFEVPKIRRKQSKVQVE